MKRKLTPYKELDAVLVKLSKDFQSTLKDNFIGMYLLGSLAVGDFDLTSDVDFIVVIKEDLSDDQVDKIQKIHLKTYAQKNRWVKRLEYSFVPLKLLKKPTPFRYGDSKNIELRKIWYFDNGHKLVKKSEHDNTLVVLWTFREKEKIVSGPNPKELISFIDKNALKSEIKTTLVGWGQDLISDKNNTYKNRFYQSYLVLNYCRMLYNLYLGKITSKLEAVRWAKKNLDQQWVPLIDFCWKERLDSSISVRQPADEEVFEQVIKFVKYVVDKGKEYKI